MTEQPQDASPTYTEAPASWNVKYTLDGYECMLTLRANSGAELMPKTLNVIRWLSEHEATPGKPQPNGHIPATSQAIAPPPATGGQPPAPATNEQHAFEIIPVNTITHVVSEKGHHSLKVKGGKFSKFGVTAWSEVIPVQGWEAWEIGKDFAPPDGMQFATVQDGKKVTQFRATQA